MSRATKILVILPNWLGDAVMVTPALELLKSICPSPELTLVGRGSSAFIFCKDDFVKDIVLDDTKAWSKDSRIGLSKLFSRLIGTFRLATRLRATSRFDISITFRNNFYSALLLFLSGARVRIGYGGLRRFLLTNPVDKSSGSYPRISHQVLSYVNLLSPIYSCIPSDTDPGVNGVDGYRELLFGKVGSVILQDKLVSGLKAVSVGHRAIGIGAGASYGTSKMWPWKYYVEVILHFICNGSEVRLYGTDSELSINRMIVDGVHRSCNTEYHPRLVNLTGMTNSVCDLVSSLMGCSLYIGNDSGVMHVAHALKVPVVSFYGPMTPGWAVPWSIKPGVGMCGATFYDNAVAVERELPCSGCRKRKCPLEHHDCMRLITPDEVLRLSLKILASNG